MYTLYSMSGTCSSAIHTLLVSQNIPVNIVFHKDVDDYHEINPTGQVPALKTPDGILTEGAAISLYLIEKHNIAVDCELTKFNQLLMFNYATLHPAYSKMFTVHFAMEPSTEKDKLMQVLASKTAELWKIVDKRLAENEFMAGHQVSLLDYLITIYASWGSTFPYVSIPLGNNVLRVAKHVSSLPSFKTVIKRENMQFILPFAA